MSIVVDGKSKLTYEEYRHFPDDGMRHEIIDGAHYMSPAPGTDHQSVSRHLQFALYRRIEENGLGYVFDAPTDLQLALTDVVQPDLIVVLSEHREIILPSRIRGVPDLVVEILSPSTTERDLTLKRALYEHHAVPEYWIVNIDERSIQRFRLQGAEYGEPEMCTERIDFADAEVDLSRIWQRL
jgi:Uma2 family endonuclease